MTNQKANGWALMPFVLFLLLFIGTGVITGDFYKLPVVIAIMIAAVVALAMNRKESLTSKIERFAKGAGNIDIMMMVFIFILAGGFSESAKGMGAVKATVNVALTIIPENLLVVGLFLIAAFISLAMGTSMGTIAALGPIGAGISGQTDLSMALTLAAVIGGAMFGDNLSIISDTTIAAVRTQQTQMRDKFKVNFMIVLPAAIITCLILFFVTMGNVSHVTSGSYTIIKLLPYVLVLVAALLGLNVFIVLGGGIVLSGIIGLADGSYHITSFLKTITDGMFGMSELVFLAIFIGGTVELISYNGGISFLLNIFTKRISTKKGAEFGIAGLVSATNLSTANNTISIITAGPLAKQIADEYGIDRRKSASLLDIFSCSIQGLIPYGAQALTAAKIGSISPVSLVGYSFYPILIALCGMGAILIGYPKRLSKNKGE
ncbi:Na+/H+ antiporter family protein [Fictibacillus macauensis ZFHKF-1]|uniref:Na+/H+ antiporter family protein n=1 Tax=Fictibacillus macauensis ZFHKF-1 TaxID=1196324 RepID=I8AIN6_9BACL|nr:Na+/H+ antiporter NhaC family protein [Fictibacillus macauensis]EIT85592.1 Na+/H+ antiporter family protein [Fictibacillus macauensis ZFHKF-1]